MMVVMGCLTDSLEGEGRDGCLMSTAHVPPGSHCTMYHINIYEDVQKQRWNLCRRTAWKSFSCS